MLFADTKMLQLWVAVSATLPAESEIMPVKFTLPLVVGVPEINPVAAFRVRPPGRLPMVE